MPISYGATNAQSDDPYAIENSMAQGMLNPKTDAMALLLLNSYGAQRKTASDNADMALQSQHQFARQQLAAQLQKDAAEAATNAAKTPGGLSLFAGQRDGYGSQYSQELLRSLITRQDAMETAERAGKILTAAKAGVDSGYVMPTADVSNIAGMNIGREAPLSTQNAQIAATAKLAAAQTGQAPRMTITGQGPGGRDVTLTFKVGEDPKVVDEAFRRLRFATDQGAQRVNAPGSSSTPPPAPGGSSSTPATPRGPDTVPQTNQSQVPQSARALVGAALDYYKATNPAVHQRLLAVGGSPQIQMFSDGQPYILDADKNPHPLYVGANKRR